MGKLQSNAGWASLEELRWQFIKPPTNRTSGAEAMATTRPCHVAISFAGEDRKYAESLALSLKHRNLTVFYDRYEKASLWGKNLYTHLSDVYLNQATYCVMLLSKHYATKVWTRHEREAAQARAFQENAEYILPVRLDDTQIPGILPTIG